jgi:hypothetical protein
MTLIVYVNPAPLDGFPIHGWIGDKGYIGSTCSHHFASLPTGACSTVRGDEVNGSRLADRAII